MRVFRTRTSDAEAQIRAAIRERGRLPFADFMSLALYGPGGYYDRGSDVVGPEGDFITSPEIHPAFGACVAMQAEAVWLASGCPDRFEIVEFGAGSGALARDMLSRLRRDSPACFDAVAYRIVEQSAHLVERQRGLFADPDFAGRVTWEHVAAPMALARSGPGFVIANEFLDALPFHLAVRRADALGERYVTLEENRPVLAEGELSSPDILVMLGERWHWLQDGDQAEICSFLRPWLESLVAAVDPIAVLVVDYAQPFGPQARPRPRGGLRCYWRHTVNDDPLRRIGEQDITADVDFSAVAREAESLGFRPSGPIAQRDALDRFGVRGLSDLLQRDASFAPHRQANARALAELSDPEGLGRVQWLLLERGLPDLGAFDVPRPPRWTSDDLLPAPTEPTHQVVLEPMGDFERMWRDFWSGQDEDAGEPER